MSRIFRQYKKALSRQYQERAFYTIKTIYLKYLAFKDTMYHIREIPDDDINALLH